MERSAGGGGRLIVVCGLPGAGKTTHAARLERAIGAVRMSADEWMGALGVNLHEEGFRARVEELQWTVAQRLLRLRMVVVIEWGTWGRGEGAAAGGSAGGRGRGGAALPGHRV